MPTYKTRVQEYVSSSRKYHMSHKGYDNLLSALKELRARAHMQMSMNPGSTIETDKETHVTVVSPSGRIRRRFTLVNGRGTEPIPFGHLVRKTQEDK